MRGPGGFIGVHSGGWHTGLTPCLAQQGAAGHIRPRPGELAPALAAAEPEGDGAPPRSHAEPEWALTYLSVILALTAVGEGDGCTTLVPGSHKGLFRHPRVAGSGNMRVDGAQLEGAADMHLGPGGARRRAPSLHAHRISSAILRATAPTQTGAGRER